MLKRILDKLEAACEREYLGGLGKKDRETGETMELGPEDGVPWRK